GKPLGPTPTVGRPPTDRQKARSRMNPDALTHTASATHDAVLVPLLSLFLVMGLIQVIRPQLLWRVNARLQKGWVKSPDATEPTSKGYALQRVSGVVFLGVATWMLIQVL
ncbi:DUF6199 family natural product biosynthesis protein, partial [Streptomyces roseolus]|uniref:DUF6199 family natural product biosynthesis protein n=2 Tax=Streptomyces roseolus TaxID=67358 RepID=UPI00365120E6